MTSISGYKTDRIGAYIEKDPDARLDYTVDWSDWVVGSQTITNSHWTISTIASDPSPLVEFKSNVLTAGDHRCTVYLANGSVGNTYTVTNRITDADGIRDERYFRIIVKQRSL